MVFWLLWLVLCISRILKLKLELAWSQMIQVLNCDLGSSKIQVKSESEKSIRYRILKHCAWGTSINLQRRNMFMKSNRQYLEN